MREPVIREDAEDKLPEPQPSTSGAGRRGPPTAVGSGLGDEPPSDPPPPAGFTGRHNIPIEALNLSMRGYNCLRRSGYRTVGQVIGSDEKTLIELRNFGRKSYDELRERLDEMGILPLEADLGRGS